MRIQAEVLGQNAVAAMSQLHGLQTGEQPTLLLVEQAVENQNGGFEFIGRYLKSRSSGEQRNRLRDLPGAELIPSLSTIGGSVQEASPHLGPPQTSRTHQVMKGVLDLDVECVGQLVGEATARRWIDEGLDGGHQSAMAGKPNGIAEPQAGVVKAGGFAERIVAAAMGITG